jgi:hypothetical protein
MAQVGEHLPSKHKVLSLNPNTARKREREREKKERKKDENNWLEN